MWEIGKSYLFYTAGAFFHVGRVVALTPTHAKLEDASRVYDIGVVSSAHKTGKFTRSDYLGEHIVCLLGADAEPWNHKLPTLIES
jgi:hypothetical protein